MKTKKTPKKKGELTLPLYIPPIFTRHFISLEDAITGMSTQIHPGSQVGDVLVTDWEEDVDIPGDINW